MALGHRRGQAGPPRAVAAVAWTLFSAVVGAGYASGQELVFFLGSCRRGGPTAALAVGAFIALACALFPRELSPGPVPPWARAAGRWAAAGRGVALLLTWTALAVTLAGMAHLAGEGRSRGLFLAAAAGATWLGAALPLHRGLVPLSRTLGPLIAVAILLEAVLWAAAGAAGRIPPAPPRLPAGARELRGCLEGLATYAAGNAVFAAVAIQRPVALVGMGRRSLATACMAGGLLTGAVAACALVAVRLAGTEPHPMPLLAAAERLHPVLGALHRLVVGAAAYTTAVAGAHALASWGARAGTAGTALPAWAAVAVASALPAAAGGFVESVRRLYPVGGWLALAALAAGWAFAAAGRRRLY